MALQFTTVEEPSFDRGIDARSAENQIKAGFARNLVNVDIVESRVRKRRGFISHAGNIPMRVQKLEQDAPTQKLSFILDSSIDLSRLTSCPLLVYGKSSNITLGPFTTTGNTYRYYPSWESNLRKSLAVGTSTITAPFTEHNIETTEIFTGLFESTSGGDLSGNAILPNSFTIDVASKDISAEYTNGNTSPVSVFLYYRDQSPVSGKAFTHPFTVGPGSNSISIAANVHQLDSYNIVYQLYRESGGEWVSLRPTTCTISDTGTISFTVDTNDPAILPGTNCRALLSSAPLSQTKSFSVTSASQITLFNVENPFLFFNVFYKTNSTTLEEVGIDAIVYDDAEKTLTLSWSLDTTTYDKTFEFFYTYGTVRTNRITVADVLVSSTASDSLPQLSLYGLSHATAYGEEKKGEGRRGWVNHVDSYRSPRTTHVVSGLGGNFFAALAQNQMPEYPELLPTWYPSLNARVSNTAQNIGPAFCDFVFDDIVRTRGAYSFPSGTFGWARVQSVTWDPGSGHTRYVLFTPNRIKKGADPIVAGDFLTVEKMSYSRHSGTFEIVSCDDSDPHTLTITVKNPKLTTSDYDDAHTSGQAGVFTDQVTLQGVSPFVADDQLLSSSWGEETIMRVYEVTTTVTANTNPDLSLRVSVTDTSLFPASGTLSIAGQSLTYSSKDDIENYFTLTAPTTVSVGQVVKLVSSSVRLSSCYNNIPLSAGLILTGRRRSTEIPLRTLLNATPPSLNIVAGDVLAISGISHEVTAVSVSNNVVTLDEELEWYDDFSLPPTVSVARRWHPIESPVPTSTDTLVPRTTIQYLDAGDYDNQSFVRSAMVRNNLYLTNGADEVYKYDGGNVYRAGIIPWQPGLFASVENIGFGGIGLTPVTVNVSGAEVSGQKIKLDKVKAAPLAQGDVVRIVFGSPSVTLDLTINDIEEISSTEVLVSFVEGLSGVSNTSAIVSIDGIYYASYFFRFNIKDRNGVTIASAVSGDTSFLVKIAPNTSAQVVLLRLVGLPVWDRYDYREGNIELEIFRSAWTTKAIGEIPFPYRLATIPLTFEANSGYIDFRDTYSKLSLSEEDSDLVSRILSPTEVPVTWDEPLRGKYLTTVGNRLVLGNITSWPTFAVEFLANKDVSYSDFAGQKFTFRRDVTTAGTVTNMVDVAAYELRASANAKTIYPVIATNPNEFCFAGTALPSVASGDWVYLYHNAVSSGNIITSTVSASTNKFGITGTIPNGTLVHFTCTGTYPTYVGGTIEPGRGYFVVNSGSNEFQIALTPGGAVLDISATNTGTLSVLWDGSELTYSGWWQIASVGGGVITIKKSNTTFTTTPTQFPDRALFATNTRDIPVLLGEDGNLGMANGNGPVPYLNVIRRLGLAINATMRVVNTTLTASFTPWLMAQSELWTGGQLIVKRPRADQETPTLQITSPSVAYSTYLNDELAAGVTPARTLRYPSRVLVSYDNYPEIFSNPTTDDLSTSVSAIDVNAADGQEITGVVPFFGSSAFDASQQSGVLVVFKQNSIYVIDVASRRVQKIETQGLGCTAPYSIAPTKDGVAFANESGIYVLRRDYRIEYVGRFMERNWNEQVDLDSLALAQGHHYGIGKQYKLSIPLIESSTSSYAENEQVFVYNYTGEADGNLGGWTKYTNHYATGWCNLFQDAFYGDVNGQVQRIRNVGNSTDYRDGATAITAIIETRPTAFENTAIRKAVSNIVVHYRSGANSDKTTLGMATDLATEYQASTAFRVMTSGLKTGLSDAVGQDVVSIMHSFPKRKCLYAGVQIVNSGLDDNVEVAGMSYVVAGLSSAGVKQAAETEG